ncbi:glycosyltransferase [Loigolactobacillus coryniformis]|uniref:glycosyltransferase n=1 Tax=Loigolactobacillus coryniformis TaxID=1610 RepID=UPI003F290C4A
MELSIIIPMYNATNYIDRCLNSIAQQSWLPQSFEIIIIDDGSTDDSVMLAKKWQSKLPLKLLTQKNQKQAVARNKGLEQAIGRYIMFTDIDDDLQPDMIQQLFQLSDGADLVEAGINKIFVATDGRTSRQEIELPMIRQAKDKNELIKLYFSANTECDVGLWNKLFRRTVIEQHQLRFTNANFFEDSLFIGQYLNAISIARIRFIERPMYNFYKRQGSTTTAFHQEIDQLSVSYLAACYQLLQQTKLNRHEQNNLIAALKLRVWIYAIHHHVKYDPAWRIWQQRDYLYHKVGIISSLKPNIPRKYRLAFWFMLCFTATYNKLYCRKYL